MSGALTVTEISGLELLPPGMILILGGLLLPFLPLMLRRAAMILLPLAGLAHLWSLPLGLAWSVPFFGYDLELVRLDALSRIFGTVFCLAGFLSGLYALHLKDRLQPCAGMIYAGSAIAATFAGDLVTLFIFWELTAITSVFLIWAGRSETAIKVGLRYLVIQVGSGVLLLAGALMHYQETGSLAFGHLGLVGPGSVLIFLAFGIKAAFPLLHNWLQDSYPHASAEGTVFLSAFTTKLAIYALARGFAGTEILIPIGAVMTAFPIFYAVIENDLRRVLAYSLNNQLGFMVVGVGIGTELALNGTAAHAFAHIIYKALLFMAMGAVLHRVGTTKASELGGLAKHMPWTAGFCVVGSLAISAFPLLSGFVTKSMILTAAVEEHYTWAFVVMLFASAGVVDHSGIKVPFFSFFAHEQVQRRPGEVKEAPWNMLAAMAIAAFFCIAIGLWPAPLYELLPFAATYDPYTMTHVMTQLQLLFFAALGFGLLYRYGLYPPEIRSTNLDFDWTYRKAAPALVAWMSRGISAAYSGLGGVAAATLSRIEALVRRTHAPPGRFGEPWPTGSTTLWAAILLMLYLIVEFFYTGL